MSFKYLILYLSSFSNLNITFAVTMTFIETIYSNWHSQLISLTKYK